MEKRRASQKGLELWLAKDSDQKQSKVSHSAYYFFICRKKRCITGNILGKKQDELVARGIVWSPNSALKSAFISTFKSVFAQKSAQKSAI